MALVLASFAVTLILSTPLHAQARTLARVTLPDTLTADGVSLRLNGMALYQKLTFKVLVAGLYLEGPERSAERVLAADRPRRYVTRFLRDVGAKRIRDAWRKGFRQNSPDAPAEVRAQFEQLCGWIRDFRRGDEIVVTYVPGRGSEIQIPGAKARTIPGKGFADAYFALVLGPKPVPGEKFKRRLLAG
jgi:chalcone isomerase-like protein